MLDVFQRTGTPLTAWQAAGRANLLPSLAAQAITRLCEAGSLDVLAERGGGDERIYVLSGRPTMADCNCQVPYLEGVGQHAPNCRVVSFQRQGLEDDGSIGYLPRHPDA